MLVNFYKLKTGKLSIGKDYRIWFQLNVGTPRPVFRTAEVIYSTELLELGKVSSFNLT